MSAAVRARLRKIDPRASWCEGPGSVGCLKNAAEETECENGICANREVQRGCYVPTESHWYGDKGWGLRVTVDARRDEIVEQYVGEVLEPDDFWERFGNTSGDEPMFFCEFVHGLVIDARLKGSYARLINHSCKPNAAFRQRSIRGSRHVVVMLLRDVKAGEEVTIAYRDPVTSRQWVCKCGHATCVNNVVNDMRALRASGVSVPAVRGDDEVVVVESEEGC